jgi:hypothetical protein
VALITLCTPLVVFRRATFCSATTRVSARRTLAGAALTLAGIATILLH